MPVIAVINRKGGSGKSTLATHLAGYCARQGLRTMLGDTDRQQSTQSWLRERTTRPPAGVPPIVGWALDTRSVLRPPPGVTHVVLDTPGGIGGFDLARVVSQADAVLIPVGPSLFDRESAAACAAELKALPRVAGGRCKVALVGMRLDGRTRAAEQLAAWAATTGLPFIGVLREAQAYVRCVELGLTVFDLPDARLAADRAQWQPIIDWLAPVLAPVAAEPAKSRPRSTRPCTAAGEPRPLPQPRPAPAALPAAPRLLQPLRGGDVPRGILEAAPRPGWARRLAEWLAGWAPRRPRRA